MSGLSHTTVFLVSNLAALACVIIAAIGVSIDADAWGWFLLVALFAAKSPPGYHYHCSCGTRMPT